VANLEQGIATAIGAIVGGGGVGFIVKLALTRTLKTIDSLVANMNTVGQKMVAYDHHIDNLQKFQTEAQHIVTIVTELKVHCEGVKKDLDEAFPKIRTLEDKTNKYEYSIESVKELNSRMVAIEHQVATLMKIMNRGVGGGN